MEIISRSEAKALGQQKYFTGKPCKHGHVSERYVDGGCVLCSPARSAKYYAGNQTLFSDNRKKRRRGDPELYRNWNLKHKYGLTPEDFSRMVALQNDRCAICGTDKPGRWGRWVVDHCHNTGEVRGLLCDQCNILLGNAKDNPAILRVAADYLERSMLKEAA